MRIKDKTREIEAYIEELSQIKPRSMREYSELKTKAACERYVEKIVEAACDLSNLLIKEMKIPCPEDERSAFDALVRGNVIPAELAERLKDARGMRNIIAHKYGRVDDEIIYHAITAELENDMRAFILSVNKLKLK